MKKKKKVARKPTYLRRMSTYNLCLNLVGIAGFHIDDEESRMKIYEAVRRLQMLDKAAKEAGLL